MARDAKGTAIKRRKRERQRGRGREIERERERGRGRGREYRKMAMNKHLSIITLNVNGLNAPVQRHRVAEWKT